MCQTEGVATSTSARTSRTLTARSRRTRAALVSGVRAELAASGTFTAGAVASRARCSAATFYSHFGSKDDALTAAFEQVLGELVELSIRCLDLDRLETGDLDVTIAHFVDEHARFFRRESLVFRMALSRLPHHRPIRVAYRDAERRTVDHLESVFGGLIDAGRIAPARPGDLAVAFMVASQGINNPRALAPSAATVRSSLARGLSAIVAGEGGAR